MSRYSASTWIMAALQVRMSLRILSGTGYEKVSCSIATTGSISSRANSSLIVSIKPLTVCDKHTAIIVLRARRRATSDGRGSSRPWGQLLPLSSCGFLVCLLIGLFIVRV
jgi:hypothetical protein